MKQFSIIVPIFGIGRADHFDTMLASYGALNEWKTTELIIVEMIKSPTDKFLYKAPEYKHVGVVSGDSYLRSHLLNAGAEKADGEYLVFHDVDVPFPPNFFVELRENIRDSSAFSNFTEFIRVEQMDTDLTFRNPVACKFSYGIDKPLGKHEGHGDGWTKLSCTIKREVFDEVGRWHEGYVGWGLEDDDMSRRLEHLGYKQMHARWVLNHMWHPLTSPNWEKPEASKKLYELTKANPGKIIDELRVSYGC